MHFYVCLANLVFALFDFAEYFLERIGEYFFLDTFMDHFVVDLLLGCFSSLGEMGCTFESADLISNSLPFTPNRLRLRIVKYAASPTFPLLLWPLTETDSELVLAVVSRR